MSMNWRRFAFIGAAVQAATIISTQDERLRFVGRFTNEPTPRFSWPSSQIEFAWDGPAKVYANFSGEERGDRFLVIVDKSKSNYHKDFFVKGQNFTEYLVVDLSAHGPHTAVLWKATEWGVVQFGGLRLDVGDLKSAPPPAKHRLEFIGDSDTAGWCADGQIIASEESWANNAAAATALFAASTLGVAVCSSALCVKNHKTTVRMTAGFAMLAYCVAGLACLAMLTLQAPSWALQNSHEAWATQLAHALSDDIEFHTQAVSGAGVMEEFYPIEQYLDLTLKLDPSAGLWDFRRFTPEAVLILLGPNDDPLGQPVAFVASYLGLLNQVVANYAPTLGSGVGMKIINICGGSINGLESCSGIQEANDEFNASPARQVDGFRGFFVTISDKDWFIINGYPLFGNGFLGCSAHYQPRGHALLVASILDQVKSALAWED